MRDGCMIETMRMSKRAKIDEAITTNAPALIAWRKLNPAYLSEWIIY